MKIPVIASTSTGGLSVAAPFDADELVRALLTGAIVRVGNVRHALNSVALLAECVVCGARTNYKLDALGMSSFVDEWPALLRRHEHGKGAA